MTAGDELDFARRLGKLLNVPLLARPPQPSYPEASEFYFPKGQRHTLSSAGNSAQLAKWRPGWAILGAMGGKVAGVDVDPRNGGDVGAVRQLLDGLGVRVYAEVETPGPGPGRHFYVPGHPELASAHDLTGWPGVDIQSFGSLLFLPGTQRPKWDGAGYKIIFDNLEALADGGDPDAGAALAGWVAERRGKLADFEPAPPWNGKPPNAREAAYLSAVLDRMYRDLSRMGKDSGRNTAVYNAAMGAGNFIAGAGMDEAHAFEILLDACGRNGLVGEDGEESVLASIRSGIRNGKVQPRAVPDNGHPDQQEPPPDDDHAGEYVPPPADSAGDAWEAEHGAAFQLALEVEREAHKIKVRDLARQKLAQEAAAGLELPNMVSLTEFLAMPDPEKKYLIDETWPKGGHVLFAAQWKAGKSTARDNVVRCLADGEPFLGRFEVEPITEGTIVVIDDELDQDMLRAWLRDQRIVNTDRVVVVPMRGKAGTFDLTLPEVRAIWVERLRDVDAAVVVLDCLRPILDALGLSEDKEAGRFLVQFDAMLQEAGVRYAMIIHHMGHANERARGDSGILAWGDSLWKLVYDNTDDKVPLEERARYFTAFGRDVHVRESRLSYDEHARRLTISGGTRSESKAEDAWPDVRDYIAKHPDCSGAEIENNVDHHRQPIRDAVKAAEKRGEIQIDRSGGKGKPNKHRLSDQTPLFEDNLATSPEPRQANPRGTPSPPRHLAPKGRGGGGGVSEANVADLAGGEVKVTVFDLLVREYNKRGQPSGRTLFDLLGGEPMLQKLRNYSPNSPN